MTTADCLTNLRAEVPGCKLASQAIGMIPFFDAVTQVPSCKLGCKVEVSACIGISTVLFLIEL